MAKMYQPPSENGKQTTLDGQASQGSSTVTLADASGLQAPGVIVVDRIDANGNETPTKREYIAFTGISSNTLTGCTRGLGGSSDQVHSDGAIAEAVVDVVWGQGVYDGFNTEHDATDGTHSDIHADSIELGGAGATADSIKDEDDMASDSATAIPSQQSVKAYVDSDIQTATDGATVTFDLGNGANRKHKVTLGGNRTLALDNELVGQAFIIDLIQDGTGSRTVTWFSTIKWAGGSAPTLTTDANAIDTFGFIVTSAGNYQGYVVGQGVA